MRALEASRVAVYLAVGVSIAAYSIAEGGAVLPLIALPLWALAWPVAQGAKGKALPRALIFALVLAATAYVIATVVKTPEDLVAAVSRYLVCLQVIKLYDRSEARDRGQQIMMSVFLALGACLTSNSMWLGVALCAFLPLLLVGTMLHQSSAVQQRVEAARSTLRPADRRRLPVRLVAGARSRRDFAVATAVCGSLCAIAAAVVFLATPRKIGLGWMGAWSPAPVGAEIGFTDEVRLGTEGTLSESGVPVFDLRLTDMNGRDIGEQFSRVALRGAVLEEYDAGQARWRRGNREAWQMPTPSNLMAHQNERLSQATRDGGKYPGIVQQFTFRNKAPGPMFAMYRPVRFTPDSFVRFTWDSITQTMDLDASGRVTYTVISQQDAPMEAGRVASAPRQAARLPALFRTGRIRTETDRVLTEAGLARDPEQRFTPDDERIAREIERHLQANYEYTTDMKAPRPGQDPIEEFLFARRQGHCEYFASAMAAMCRSVGMDARVVTGYLASEKNEDGSFVVRQNHAHAWTEVAVAPGLWKTFDASPAAEVDRLHAPKTGILARLRGLLEASERFWIASVVGYDPEQHGGGGSAGAARLDEIVKRFGERGARTGSDARGRWLSAVATGAMVFAGVGVGAFLAQRLWRWIAARRGWKRAMREAEKADPTLAERMRQVTFYSDLLARLKRAGLAGEAWQAPMQRIDGIAGRDARAAEAARRIVELYYEGRFGKRVLSQAEVEEARGLVEEVGRRLAA